MRYLPRKRSERQQNIINAVEDFCGDDGTSLRNKTNAALWLMGRKKGIELNEDEKYIVWYVDLNLCDEVYRKSLLSESL